jgi:hypothetical protein
MKDFRMAIFPASLLQAQIFVRINKIFNFKIPIKTFFQGIAGNFVIPQQ